METMVRAVDLARTLRSQNNLKVRQPLARMWVALPNPAGLVERDALLELVRDEVNVKDIEIIGDESELVDRRVKPLLPKIGKKLGNAIPAVMSAAREGRYEILNDGSVRIGGVTLAPDEVEIQATPRAGTAVAHDEGLVVVIDTELTPELRAEADARELQRAIQDARKDAGVELDDEVRIRVEATDAIRAALEPFVGSVAAETRSTIEFGDAPSHAQSIDLDAGTIRVGLLPGALHP
jgi:isoleucyl-tRNA synthetase